MVTTGLSGNDIYCVKKLGFHPGEILIGNSVYSIGFVGSLTSGFRSMMGGEVSNITSMITEGRVLAINRMITEARQRKGLGIAGVRSDFIHHAGSGNIEFLSVGSAVHSEHPETDQLRFTASADGQELWCNMDAGYSPVSFAFGNVAYALGLGQGIIGSFKKLGRGEIREYSDVFNRTRHTALQRIIAEAKRDNANSVLNITTKVIPYAANISEMLMVGTASYNPALPEEFKANPITSDLTSSELWSITNLGMMPVKLLLGTAVYSLGLAGSLTSFIKSFTRGEINATTTLIYEAREHAIGLITNEAKSIGADDVLGVKTYIYQLGNGLIEFLAIGTAVKKVDFVKTKSETILPQAIIADRDTYFDHPGLTFGGNEAI